VFVRNPDSRISAVLVDADDPRVERDVIEPFGLGGWRWGVLRLHDLPVDPAAALLGEPGAGLEIFQQHFTRFRPLVTATALGAEAGCTPWSPTPWLPAAAPASCPGSATTP
jgi:alkylation response protein AidB-like acyl-CoA dehydrogenase